MKEGVAELETAFQGKIIVKKSGKSYTVSSKNKSQVFLSTVNGELLISSSSPGVTVSTSAKSRLLVDGEVIGLNDKLEKSNVSIPKVVEKSKKTTKNITAVQRDTSKKVAAVDSKVNKERELEREKKIKYTSYLKIYIFAYIIFCIVLSILPESR
jgi:hypothetical protein